MAEPTPQVIRPLGKMEAYSASRHARGLYRCVTVSARYLNPPTPLATLANPAIFSALAVLVRRHPALRVGIRAESSNAPEFVSVPKVRLQDHVVFRSLPADGDYETGLAGVHAWCHDQLWPDVETRPPWRVDVVRPAGDEPEFEDVVFSFHHSLMDGTGAKVFHEEFLAALNHPQEPLQPPYILTFPSPPVLPPPQEDVIPYTTTPLFMARVLWTELAPSFLKPAPLPIWTGAPVDFSRRHQARVLPVDMSPSIVTSLLAASRAHSTSLTGLIHALCLVSLTRRLPASSVPGFKASTPMNARAYLNSPPDDDDALRIAISVVTHDFSPELLSAIRSPAADTDALVWQHAAAIKSAIRARAATLPADDPIGLLKYVTDWSSFWAKKEGQPRDYSWEVSNLGVLATGEAKREGRGGEEAKEQGQRTISRALFTNGIMVAGGPMSVSVVTVPGGPLTASITWNEGVVPDKVMRGLAEDLVAYTTRLHETGKFAVEASS